MQTARHLVKTWLILDFFGDSRRSGRPGSTLTTTVFTQSFVSLVLAALLFPETPPVAYAAACLCLSTLFVSLGSLGDTERAERRRVDRALLGTAPVARLEVAVARLLHGGFSLGAVSMGMAIPPAVLLAMGENGNPARIPAYLLAACLCSGIAVGVLSLFMKILRRLLGEARAQLVAGTAKALLLGFGLLGFAICLAVLEGTADDLVIGRAGALALPPYWAARWVIEPGADLGFLLALVGTAVVLFGLTVLVPEGDPSRSQQLKGEGLLRRLDRTCTRRGPLLGMAVFTSTMLYRSPGYRARVLPLLGMPVAMMFLALRDPDPQAFAILMGVALQFPAIYLPFLVAFLPHADQEGTGWLFATAPGGSLQAAREGALVALTTHVLVPLLAVAAAGLLLMGYGIIATVALTGWSFGLAVATGTIHLRAMQHVPFTADGEDATALDFGGLLTFGVVLACLGGAFALVAESLWAAGIGLAAGGLALFRLGRGGRNERD